MSEGLHELNRRYSHIPPGGGQNCGWSADHAFVKVSAADKSGQCALTEDNPKANFRLGLRMHRYHAETSYILDGSTDFFVYGEWMTTESEGCPRVPPGIERACVQTEGCSAARMLMIFQPSGFDQFPAQLAQTTDADFEDGAGMRALEGKYDTINIGPAPNRPQPKR